MSGRTFRNFIRRMQPNGKHLICYHCDSLVPGDGRCLHCGSTEWVAPCLGDCVLDYYVAQSHRAEMKR